MPREGDGHLDYIQWYPVQDETNQIVVTTDADWATCKESRRSNSGGTLQLGDHLLAAWSRVEPRIALSSREAELYAGMRGISEALGFVHMMREFKTNDWGRILHRVDASAGRAIMLRRGCGGLKHITVKSLWVQEAVRENAIETVRISRDEMHAHILASPCSADELTKHLTKLNGFRIEENEEIEYELEGSMSAGDNVRGSHVEVPEGVKVCGVACWRGTRNGGTVRGLRVGGKLSLNC